MGNKIRMGIIGLGQISYTHISGIMRSADAELVALCDIDEARLLEKSKEYNISQSMCFSDYKKMIDHPEVDAISICTPNDCHYDMAMYAVDSSKPFALEKPITLNKDQAKKLYKKCYDNNVKHMVCFSYRFKAAARYARYLIESGYIGKVHHAYGSYYQSWANSNDIPKFWRFDKERSGSGTLGDIGCHMIDLVSFIVGDITDVAGDSATIINSRKEENGDKILPVQIDDYFNALVRIENGISGTITSSRFAYGRGNYQSLEIYGEKGAIVYNLEHTDTLQVCQSEVMARGCQFIEVTVPGEFEMDQMQQFFNIINNKEDGLAGTLEDGYKNQAILDSMLEADENRSWVKVDY